MKSTLAIVALTLCLLIAGLSGAAFANTFVGNGGGQGDVELAVTKKQMTETLDVIQSNKNLSLCKCNPAFQNRTVCESLDSLTESERGFCAKKLHDEAENLANLLNASSGVRVRWTDEAIEVSDHESSRAVDAATDRKTKTITVNLKRFLSMAPFERVFLLTHEYSHFLKNDGKPIEDDGPVGSFTGEEGGRRLLNAMGSATAVLQGEFPKQIRSYKARLHRSQSWRPMWVELTGGQSVYNDSPKQTFATESFSRLGLTARYNFGNFGLVLGGRTERNSFTALDTIHVTENVDILSLGAAYRFYFFSDPLTFWGQSHLLVQGLLDLVHSSVELNEEGVPSTTDNANAVGGSLNVSYYVPLFWGLWGEIGAGVESHPYSYSKLNLKYNKPLTSTSVGVSYAF